ncbi:oligosaccharide flippase family protein, partial [Priestia megaterium]|uniref:oligosaccharide flippase family protein n=1 Tax=Priestia megaterium TaxID=1404 RepID=UPI0035B6579C
VLPALNLWSKTRWKKFDLNMLKKLWSYGAPLTLLYLFVMVIGFSDRIFIDVMLEASDVGIYSAAYDLTQYTIAVFGSIVHLASFPVIIRAYESSGERMARLQLAVTIRIL